MHAAVLQRDPHPQRDPVPQRAAHARGAALPERAAHRSVVHLEGVGVDARSARRAHRQRGRAQLAGPSSLGSGQLGEGEEDREVRDAWWVVHVREDSKGREHLLTPPTIDALARYPVGATLSLETWWDGRFTERAPPEPPAPVPGSR